MFVEAGVESLGDFSSTRFEEEKECLAINLVDDLVLFLVMIAEEEEDDDDDDDETGVISEEFDNNDVDADEDEE